MESPERLQDAWRFRAHLDWVEVKLNLLKPTQTRHLRGALPSAWHGPGGAPFVKAPDEIKGKGSTATTFKIKVQDPESAAAVARRLDDLSLRHPFAAEPEITGVEIALDAFPIHDSADLVSMAAHFHRGTANPPSSNRRVPGFRGTRGFTESASLGLTSVKGLLRQGRVTFTNDMDAPHTQRVYVKNGEHARFENTLTGSMVPFTTTGDWRNFKFESLAKLFCWRIDRDDLLPLQGALLGWKAVIDYPTDDDRRRRARQMTVADRALSDQARYALRRLTTAQRQR